MATPGWLNALSNVVCEANSLLPQLLLMALAPSAAAVFSAFDRCWRLELSASTNRMLQFGQIAETMSTSSDSSKAQLLFLVDRLSLPSSPTIRRQPFAVVHVGSPNVDR